MAKDLEKEQDEASVKSEEFKDNELDLSEEGHECTLQIPDSSCSKGRRTSNFKQIAKVNVDATF